MKKSHHWLQSSSLGNDLAFCTLCSSNFSVASGGLYDIKRHSETSLHKKAVTATNKTPQLHQFMPTKSVDDQVTRAETLFSNFVAEHNLPFTVSDHKEPFTDKLSFRVLPKLAKACCVIPIINADPERIFSMLKKIQTDMRSELSNDTICCLISTKQNHDKACFEYNPSDNVLRAAKKAVLSNQNNISAV